MGLGYVPEQRIRADSPVNAWPACHRNHEGFNAEAVSIRAKPQTSPELTIGYPNLMTLASLQSLGAYITPRELPRSADRRVFELLLPRQAESSKQTQVFRWRWTYPKAQKVDEEPVE